MKKTLCFIPFFFLAACGGEDVLNPVPQDEPPPNKPVAVVLPEGEVIDAVAGEPDDPDLDCPDDYANVDFVVETCFLKPGFVAEGFGCTKVLRSMTPEEFEEYCID